jgi:hypothetical protein
MLNFTALYWHGTKAEKKIKSSVTISSSNTGSLLEELKSKCDKINFIDGMGNEPSKRKMK